MANQHDKIFKQLLHAFLDDFLRLVVPETFDRLDLSSPEFLDKELFEGGPRGKRRELDLLVRVRTVSGRPLMIHVEVEARASPEMEERLWRYRNQILARYDTPVLTIVINLKRGRPGVCLKSWENDLGPSFPEHRYVSFGLAGCLAAEYLTRPEPLAWALAAVMSPGALSRPRAEDGLPQADRKASGPIRFLPAGQLRRKLSTIDRRGGGGARGSTHPEREQGGSSHGADVVREAGSQRRS